MVVVQGVYLGCKSMRALADMHLVAKHLDARGGQRTCGYQSCYMALECVASPSDKQVPGGRARMGVVEDPTGDKAACWPPSGHEPL